MKLVRTWQHTEVTIFTFFGHREWSSRSCKYCLRSYFLSEYSQDHSTLGLFLIMIFCVMSILWSIIMVVLDQDFRARSHGLFFQILFFRSCLSFKNVSQGYFTLSILFIFFYVIFVCDPLVLTIMISSLELAVMDCFQILFFI